MYARWGRSPNRGREGSGQLVARGGTSVMALQGRDHVDVAVKWFELSEALINQETGRTWDCRARGEPRVKGARPAVGWTLILAGRDAGLPPA